MAYMAHVFGVRPCEALAAQTLPIENFGR